jgi:hypothetical protein
VAKLAGKAPVLFAGSAVSSELAQFGSTVANQPAPPVFSTDPSVLQANGAWAQGWQDAIYSADRAPVLEEMNAIDYVISYLLCYLYQEGIAEWLAGVTYYTNSYVQSVGQIFISLQDSNTGNAPPPSASNAFWRWVNPAEYLVGAASTINHLPKVSNLSPSVGDQGSIVLTDSAVSEDGTDVIISLPLKFPDGSVQSTAAESTFVSSPQSVVIGTTAQVAHGLGVQPNFYTVSARCVNSEFGYSVGDEVLISNSYPVGGFATVFANTTFVGIYAINGIEVLIRPSGGGVFITPANWRFIYRARV